MHPIQRINHYYLTTIDGTAKIEHKKVENTTFKSLQKEGTDYSRSQTNFENTGTHTNTTTNQDGYLVLETTGDTLNIEHDVDADFDGTHNGTVTANNSISVCIPNLGRGMNGGRQLKNKIKVKFWINGHLLFVQNEETKEIKIIENQKQIAWFLNAHHLVAPEVRGVMYGTM